MGTFALDLFREQILGKYLDFIYKKINFKTKRIIDKSLQKKGIDLLYEINNKEFKVDEKAQLHYIDKNLSTFAFELGYMYNETYKKGWLYDNEKETEKYFLICNIKTINSKGYFKSFKDIVSSELIVLDRKKLIKYLLDNDISYEKTKLEQDKYRKKNKNGKIELENENRFYYYLSLKYEEKPFNIVIKKKELLKLADYSKKIILKEK